METFDAIVVGLGAHGSAAAAELARRGLRVLGLERFGRGETLGSSGGRSRIIRVAHYEDPAYAPLARASWERWEGLEAEAGTSILTISGGLYLGSPDSVLVRGAVAAARAHDVGVEVAAAEEVRRRWPAFAPEADLVGVFETRAGVLDATAANAAHLIVAERAGARLRFGTRVVAWRPAPGGGVEVEDATGAVVGAAHLVLAAGPWIGGLIPDLELPLVVERQPVCWFEPAVSPADVGPERMPIWLWERGNGTTFYGFPLDAGLGLKAARHHTGVGADPETLDRVVGDGDIEPIRAFVRRSLPAASDRLAASTVCLYTNTPDDAFVLDRHPAVPGVAYASACSGHGFKFAPLIGEILADLAMVGSTSWPIEPFRAARFGVAGSVDPVR